MFYRANIRKIGIPLQAQVYFQYKIGKKRVYITRTCFPDVTVFSQLCRSELHQNHIYNDYTQNIENMFISLVHAFEKKMIKKKKNIRVEEFCHAKTRSVSYHYF